MTVMLNKTLTLARAEELVKELGFLGVVDLVRVIASQTSGMLKCEAPRVVVHIKQLRRAKKQKGTKP